MSTIPRFDADGHLRETNAELVDYYEGAYKGLRRPDTHGIFPTLDGWPRGIFIGLGDRERKYMHTDARVWGEIIELLGLDGSVLYPTAGLALGLMLEPAFAAATSTAYNNWVEARYTKLDPRLYAAGLIPVQDPAAAAAEIERAARERTNFAAFVLPTCLAMPRSYGDPFFFPIYEAAQRHGIPLAMHGGPSRGFGFDHFTDFIKVHTLEHPVPLFIQLTDIIFSGIFDTFPDLRIACLEAGASWVPFMMDRMDYEFGALLGAGARARLKKKPSDYFRGDNLWFSLELSERLGRKYTLDAIGSERLLYASDYPHEPKENEMRSELEEFLDDPAIDRAAKENIAGKNALNFYRIGRPAPMATGR